MHKIILGLAALLAAAFVMPAATQTAQAETVVIKKGDRGHHYGWRHGHRKKVVIIKRGDRGHHYGWRNAHAKKLVIKKKVYH